MLGNWYGTVLFWRPQVALLVNEQTLYPVMMVLTPAATLLKRFLVALRQNLAAHGIAEEFIEAETSELRDSYYAKTANRSVLGIMNEFSFLAGAQTEGRGVDLVSLALGLSKTPCGPLYKHHVSPDRELDAAVAAWFERRE